MRLSCQDPYRTYHATMCGAQAMLAHRYRGYGPGIPDTLPLLSKWASDDARMASEFTRLALDQRLINDSIHIKAGFRIVPC